MKHILRTYGFLALVLPMIASAADPLGAPRARLKPGQLSLSVEHSYTDLRLNGVYYDDTTRQIDIDGLNTTYLTAAIGATEWLELFARIGVISMDGTQDVSEGNYTEAWDYDYDREPIFGGGLRLTLFTIGDFTIGAVASYSYASFNGSFLMDAIRNSPYKLYYTDWGDVDARLHQLTAALGVTWQCLEHVSVYGGFLVHHVRLKQNIETEGNSHNEWDPMPVRTVFRNDDGGSMLGGYLGVEWKITDQFTLGIEGSATGDSVGGSATCSMAF